MKDKNLNILSPRTSDPLLISFITGNEMSQNLRSLPSLVTQCHTSSTPSAPLTCDVIYGYSLV